MQNQLVLDKFIDSYQKLNKDNLTLLDDIYSADIVFVDPMHQVTGLESLRTYFANLYSNVSRCQFSICDSFTVQNDGFLYWTMQFSHSKLAHGETIYVQGHSKLKFKNDKVVEHRDYFNVADMLYKHIPILGNVINYIDKRAS
ncbi:nuclear transport factor 2 family protein [Pseudoalteromonas sp. MMG010]|uniref:nuclear transport factor 2 family protein n=1 Tax=Pseudoalteromonas sp. MMG010 TaxID=2822685 RepID=UPI001B3A4629|nr:nuclear transport factor 2 family protein [Pseudoalteromonas sp. MMG010]MBQ4833426.1 nuclear transport factor 2 family protein [Pseudoalteromonas sp. MMG010]